MTFASVPNKNGGTPQRQMGGPGVTLMLDNGMKGCFSLLWQNWAGQGNGADAGASLTFYFTDWAMYSRHMYSFEWRQQVMIIPEFQYDNNFQPIFGGFDDQNNYTSAYNSELADHNPVPSGGWPSGIRDPNQPLPQNHAPNDPFKDYVPDNKDGDPNKPENSSKSTFVDRGIYGHWWNTQMTDSPFIPIQYGNRRVTKKFKTELYVDGSDSGLEIVWQFTAIAGRSASDLKGTVYYNEIPTP